jgi:GNAT superfamily N-acetyltransferase
MGLLPLSGPSLQPVAASDFEELLALRMRALGPSLKALGRFDPARARERLAVTFAPQHMHHVMRGERRVGCVTLRPTSEAWCLDHLYIEPECQGQGLGSWVMDWVCSTADASQRRLTLTALQGSAANRFYQRYGFVEAQRSGIDIEYGRHPQTSPLQVVRTLWTCFEARDWAGARALLHDDAELIWWASGEKLVGADAIIRANAIYPEGWTLHLTQITLLQDGRVLSMLRVDHPPACFLAHSILHVRQGRIAGGEELWATCEEAPVWRDERSVPGLQRLPGWPTA